MKKFPVYKCDYIFNKYCGKKPKEVKLKLKGIELEYPCRLDAMAINPAAVSYNDSMIFTPGEVLVSINKKIKTKIEVIDKTGGVINVSDKTKRKVLVKHAYYLLCDALKVKPSLNIEVIDDEIPKHCGFGSSSSIIASVAVAINELYGNPISYPDLIKYIVANHGEEISDDNYDDLKMVQCIGGGATNGMTEEGIIIIAGRATIISKMKYESKVLIALPNDFEKKDAQFLMEEEEKNLYKFEATGKKYSEKIAYNLLHLAIPGMVNGSLKELADVVFDYRFNMGSIENCSFVYPNMVNQAKELRKLYENNDCEFLALSSVGPAYFIFVNDKEKIKKCKKMLKDLNMSCIETSICNTRYTVNKKEEIKFWEDEETILQFYNKAPSKYITDVIDKLDYSNAADIGCGGCRYSRYIAKKGIKVDAVDKNNTMFKYVKDKNINLITADMKDLPLKSNTYDLVLSIGVLHNALTLEDYNKSISELHRILKKNGDFIISVFTNEVITDDLKYEGNSRYSVNGRDPMVLLSKGDVLKLLEKKFKLIEVFDEHVTDVGDGGKRNVVSFYFKKK